MEKLTLPLYNASQAHKCLKQGWEFAKELLLAGNKLVLEIKPMSKSREQEEKYHAMFAAIQRVRNAPSKEAILLELKLLEQAILSEAGNE